MNNEPVAWMHQNPEYPISKHWSQEYNIPLYTHPVKEQELLGEINRLKQIIDANNLNQNIGQFIKQKPDAFKTYDKQGNVRYTPWDTENGIPLYAHPVKELTDEEILREAYYILMREQQRKAQEK